MKKIFQRPTVRAVAMTEVQSILAGSDNDNINTGGDPGSGRAKGAGFNSGSFEGVSFTSVTPLRD